MNTNNLQYFLTIFNKFLTTLILITFFNTESIASEVVTIECCHEEENSRRQTLSTQFPKPEEKLLYSAIRIECHDKDKKKLTGTGFMASYLANTEDANKDVYLITNKHLILKDNLEQIFVYLPFSDNNQKIKICKVCLTPNLISLSNNYSSNDEDVCSVYLQTIIDSIEKRSKVKCSFQTINFDNSHLSSQYLSPIKQIPLESKLMPLSEIVMVGYPLGFYDTSNDLPILRTGNVASNPSANYQGKTGVFLINIPLYEGSSGSPVFMIKKEFSSTRNDNKLIELNRIYFVGLVYGGPQDNMSKRINAKFNEIETRQNQIDLEFSEIKININIMEEKINELEEKDRKEYLTNSNSIDNDDSDNSDVQNNKRKAEFDLDKGAKRKKESCNQDEAANINSFKQFSDLAYVIKPQNILSCIMHTHRNIKNIELTGVVWYINDFKYTM